MFVVLILSTVLATYTLTFSDDMRTLYNWVPQDSPGSASGNNEWQYYTSRQVNVEATPDGLILWAQKQYYGGYNYTSGKVISKNTFGPYGFFNVLAGVPKGNALWPAIWLLPPNAHSIYGNYPACGSINIMETICRDGGGYSTLYFGGRQVDQYPQFGDNSWNTNWNKAHWFGVEWQPTYIQFWLNAQVYGGRIMGTSLDYITSSHWYSEKPNGTHYPGNAPFNQPFNIILNLAIGGNFPCSENCCGRPDLPEYMQIFQVDVWEASYRDTE